MSANGNSPTSLVGVQLVGAVVLMPSVSASSTVEDADTEGMSTTAPTNWTPTSEVGELPLADILPDPHGPRVHYDQDSLGRLADSLRDKGQLQPIGVRHAAEPGKGMVVGGARRYEAAKRAGMETIGVVLVDEKMSRGKVLELQLTENLLRDDLRPIEQARAFSATLDENKWTAATLAEKLHLGAATVSRSL